MNKKALFIALDVILYAIGFPIMFVIAILSSLPFIQKGIYGFTAVVPIILVALVFVATLVTELVLRLTTKKSLAKGADRNKLLKKQGIKLVIAVFCCLTAFMLILDIVFPSVLKEATQGTILYEDIVYDSASQNDVQRGLVDKFIELNVENGYLKNKTFKEMDSYFGSNADSMKALFEELSHEYRGEGYNQNGGMFIPVRNTSPYSAWDDSAFEAFAAEKKQAIIDAYKAEALNNGEVAGLITKVFKSIDGAYASFDPLVIELALKDMKYLMSSSLFPSGVTQMFASDSKGNAVSPENIYSNSKINLNDEFLYKWCILDMIGEIPEGFEDLSTLLFELDGVNTSNAKRGSLDYMSMAWLNSVSLLGIISIFTVRTWFYIFSGIIMVATLVRMLMLRPAYLGSIEKKEENENEEKTPAEA